MTLAASPPRELREVPATDQANTGSPRGTGNRSVSPELLVKKEEPGGTGQLQAAMAGEWRHLRHDHRADPAAVARDAPDPEMAGLIHDAAHMYPGAPWGEVVVRGQAGAWWHNTGLGARTAAHRGSRRMEGLLPSGPGPRHAAERRA